MNFYKELRHPLLRGILFVLLGLFVCLFADYIVPLIIILFGLLLILSSVVILSETRSSTRLRSHKRLLFMAALFSFAIGISIIIQPLSSTTVILFVTGIWLFIGSVVGILHSGYNASRVKTDRWQLLASLTVLVFALLIFADPAGVAVLLIFALGVYMFLCGCLFIAVTIFLKNRRKINLDEINSYLPAFMRYAV